MVPYIQIPIKTSKKELMQKTIDKYIFFAWTLEWLTHYRFFHDEEVINLKIIEENIYKSGLLKEKEITLNEISQWLQEMQVMKLIRLIKVVDMNKEEIALEKDGYEAYKNQTFQSMAVSLLEARESRKLAKWAVVLAVLSIIISIVIYFFD